MRRFKLVIRLEGLVSSHDLGEISIKKRPATDCGFRGWEQKRRVCAETGLAQWMKHRPGN